ncbi:MAG: lysophospholipase [Mariprofundaceae bacterium]
MQHSESSFKGADNLSLYAQQWLPDGSPRATVAIAHGIGEHSGRYMNIVESMVSNQCAIYSYDHRGHGKSPGQRGHINSWTEYRTDLLNFLKSIRSQQPDSPLFLMGHSMGALIVLDFILSEDEGMADGLAGIILSGAPIEPVGVASSFLIALARVLSRIYPRFSVDLGLDLNAISRDPAVIETYKHDPLVHAKVSVRWGTESLAAVESVKRQAENIHLPILMLHGEADSLNSAEGAKNYFNRIPVQDKEFIAYPSGYHEPHNDLDHEKMVTDLLHWVSKHL